MTPASNQPSDGLEIGTESVDAEADGFAALALRPELLQALGDLGYEEPTPIQREAISPGRGAREWPGS